MSVAAITHLSVVMSKHKQPVPRSVYATFADGLNLHLSYVTTWRQCFATLRGGDEPIFHEAPFREHIPPSTIGWEGMTRRDWANVCFAYRMAMEAMA